MRDDLAVPVIGKAKEEYSKDFFWRAFRDIEMFLTRLLSKGPLRVSSLESDGPITSNSKYVVTDAPLDGGSYVRNSGTWVASPPSLPPLDYEYSNVTVNTGIADGEFRFNNSDQTAANVIWISKTLLNGLATGTLLSGIGSSTGIYIKDVSDDTKWQAYNSTGPASEGGTFVQMNTVHRQGGSPLTDGQPVTIAFMGALP